MRVSEIFYSISGEGIHAGIPTVFVRLAGCNLTCTYCDTQYASDYNHGEELTSLQVQDRIKKIKPKGLAWLLITGGEPLLQNCEVLVRMLQGVCSIEVETNGSADPPGWFREVDCWSVDVKCPSSGPSYGSFRPRWLNKLRKQDQLKFVVSTQQDLNYVRGFLYNTRLKPTVLVSPITGVLLDKKQGTVEEYWNMEWLQDCAEFCKEHNVRLSLQLHKIIYGNKKGV